MLLLRNNKIVRFAISVYDGISPALLATISLSQNIRGSNHFQLVNSLKSANIIQSQNVIQCLKNLDRSIFTKEQKVYENKPYKISKGQCMTDIFTHAIILNNIQPHLKLKNQIKILDIGTGHGYLAFAVWNLAIKLTKIPKVKGIDCFEECIQKCNQIKDKLQIKAGQLEFIKKDVKQMLQGNEKFDVIIGGFFIQPSLSTKLENILQDDGLGIWPQTSTSGQALFLTKKGKTKQYLLETLFSQQVVRSSVQQYFISDHSEDNNSEQNCDMKLEEQNEKEQVQELKKAKNDKKTKLQQQLKQLIIKYQNRLNVKVLALRQMQQIGQIGKVLNELKKYK